MFLRSIVLFLFVASLASAQTRERGRFSLQGDPATLMAVDSQPKFALIAFGNGTICVFSTDQRIINVYTFPIHAKAVTGAEFSPDSKRFVTCGADGYLRLWDTAAAIKHHKTIEDSNGEAKPTPPKPLVSVKAHSGYGVTCLAISPDGKRIATGATDGTVKLWDAEKLKPVSSLAAAHPGGVKALQFSPAEKKLATCGADKCAKLWDTSKDKPTLLHTIEGHEGTVNAVAFSPDGKQLATGSGVAKKSGVVKVWDVATAKLAYKLDGHEDVVTCIVFHPKTAHLASGCADYKIRIWNLKEKEIAYTDEHPEPLTNLVITPNGERFGSCSSRTVRWWAGFGKE